LYGIISYIVYGLYPSFEMKGISPDFVLNRLNIIGFIKKTTDSEHNLPVYPNLTRDLVVIGMNQLWAADITYMRLVGI